jgi:hypothetical protein
MTTKLTSVWFAFAGWAKPDEDRPSAGSLTDLILEPLDSHESALWSLRKQAYSFWIEMFWGASDAPEAPDFSVMDEITIRDTLANAVEDHDDVLVEIKEVHIINHTATGWRTLDLKAKDDALRIPRVGGGFYDTSGSIQAHEHRAFLSALPDTPIVPAHRFQSGLSGNNHVTRCVVTHNGKDYFGPWRGDEASALTAALLLIQDQE